MTPDARRNFIASGALMCESGVTLPRQMGRDTIERAAPGAIERLHRSSGEIRITLKPQRIDGVEFHLAMTVANGQARRIDAMAVNEAVPEIMATGGAWTRENELARKRFHEAWAARLLGRELTIKPWLDPDLPEPVMPAWPGTDHPRHAVFDWGEVLSYFDDKGCGAYLCVRYDV